MFSSPLDVYPRVSLLDPVVVLYLVFVKKFFLTANLYTHTNIYMGGGGGERETERDFLSIGSLSKLSPQPELDWSEARIQEQLLSLPRGCRSPRTWASLHYFARPSVSGSKWSSWNLNWHPYGVLAPQEDA